MYPFELFTQHAATALNLAQEEAEAAGHRYLGTEHLLFGLIREREGLAGRILAGMGVELEATRGLVKATVIPPEPLSLERLVPTSRVKKVIELAFLQAQRMGHTYVGTEHLLLGLLVEGEGIGAQVLLDQGITAVRVREEVVKALARSEALIEKAGVPSSPEVTQVMRRASELAEQDEASSVTMEHLRRALEDASGDAS